MANDPSAAEPGRQSRTSRSEDAARRKATTMRRVAAGVGVLVLLLVAGFLLLGGEVPIVGGHHTGPGEFSFDLKRVKASPISATPPSGLQDVADAAGADVKATMDELYFRAFVDTGSWGDYGDAFALFEPKAVARAQRDTDVLTLGSSADEDYETLDPTLGTLSVVVLTDAEDAPASAIAEVRFRADAGRKDGTSTEVTSSGSFFLRPVEGRWLVFAYRIDRDERPAGSASPAEEPA